MHTYVYRALVMTVVMTVVMMEPVAGDAVAQVKTTAGLVQGKTVADGTIRVFSGIPYAAPPVGALRWKAPQPVAPWSGVRDATNAASACTQGRVFSDIVLPDLSEDCLTLNVHTPARAAGDRLPVMVWIHGGGFQAGAGAESRHDGWPSPAKALYL